MKLTYITRVEVPSDSAQSLQISDMARAFHHRLGNDFKLMTCGNDRSSQKDVEYLWVIKKDICAGWKRYFSMLYAASIEVLKDRQVVIYTRDIAIAFVAVMLRGTAVYEAHKQPIGLMAGVFTRILSSINRFKVVTISNALEAYYRKTYNIPCENITTAHDGVNLNAYQCRDSKKILEIRKKYMSDPNKILIVHTGSLYKGGGELFKYVADVDKDKIQILHVGGDKIECDEFQNRYRSLGYRNIKLIPRVDKSEIVKIQLSADYLLYITNKNNPIYWCTSPLKLFEYMATNRPIIAACGGSVKEVIDDEVAYCFSPNDVSKIFGVVKECISNCTESQRKANKAFVRVKNNFTWDIRAENIVSFLTTEA